MVVPDKSGRYISLQMERIRIECTWNVLNFSNRTFFSKVFVRFNSNFFGTFYSIRTFFRELFFRVQYELSLTRRVDRLLGFARPTRTMNGEVLISHRGMGSCLKRFTGREYLQQATYVTGFRAQA